MIQKRDTLPGIVRREAEGAVNRAMRRGEQAKTTPAYPVSLPGSGGGVIAPPEAAADDLQAHIDSVTAHPPQNVGAEAAGAVYSHNSSAGAHGGVQGEVAAARAGEATLSARLDKKADLVGGMVPAAQLPSYVDDVLNYDTLASFPATGEDGKIYVANDTNLTYRWSGSAYAVLNPSLALGETSSTAFRGDRGKTAYDHSQISGGVHVTDAERTSWNGAASAAGNPRWKREISDWNDYLTLSAFNSATHYNLGEVDGKNGALFHTFPYSLDGTFLFSMMVHVDAATSVTLNILERQELLYIFRNGTQIASWTTSSSTPATATLEFSAAGDYCIQVLLATTGSYSSVIIPEWFNSHISWLRAGTS